MVNKENCLHMAKVFATKSLATREKDPIGYHQGHWKVPLKPGNSYDWTGEGCGTVACVAGWTCAELAPKTFQDYDTAYQIETIQNRAVSLLGLDDDQRMRLFGSGANPFMGERDATCAVAAVLKHLAETDRVDWSVGVAAVKEQREKAKKDKGDDTSGK